MSNALVLPSPETVTLARISGVISKAIMIRERCLAEHDLPGAEELHRQLQALTRYVTDRKMKSALEGETRLAELLIGQLLGPPAPGSRTDLSHDATGGVTKDDRSRFRALAAEPEMVQALVDSGVTQRNKILQELERQRLSEISRAEAKRAKKGTTVKTTYLTEGVHLCDVAAATLAVEGATIDQIVTDPPYDKDAISSYEDLSVFAAHALKPGGSLVVMIGQFHLPHALEALQASPGISYHWLLAYLTPGGQAPQIFPRRVNTFWKPVVWLTKGEYTGPWVGDVAKSDVNANEKTRHKWGQSVSGMVDLIERMTGEGDLVCDPYCGGGTTGVASLALGRRFLGFDRDEAEVEVARGRLIEATS
jgi:site-specific DNA-methyltransferase (adenine-specific)